jgi:phasin family protein
LDGRIFEDETMSKNDTKKDLDTATAAMSKLAGETEARIEQARDEMTERMREMMEKSMKSLNEMSEFARGNVEAMIESAKAAAQGAETLTAHVAEQSRTTMEEAQAALRAMSSARTPNELVQAQNDFAKSQFDKAVAGWSNMSETWLKLAGDVVQPISSRMAVAAETVKKSVVA